MCKLNNFENYEFRVNFYLLVSVKLERLLEDEIVKLLIFQIYIILFNVKRYNLTDKQLQISKQVCK